MNSIIRTAEVHPLISWRSVLAGLFVSLLTYLTLLVLGVAIGGGKLITADAQSIGVATVSWIFISTGISLFAGAYFAARISRFQARVVGSSQGVVICSLFFAALLVQLFFLLGSLSPLTTASTSTVRDIVQQSLDGLEFKADAKMVSEGIANRIMQGDTDRARDYLAMHAGITSSEAQARIETLRTLVQEALFEVNEKTASVLATAGWTLFGLIIVGLLGAIGGGVRGIRTNLNHPLTNEELTPTYHAQSIAS
jgi:hypothetical protein